MGFPLLVTGLLALGGMAVPVQAQSKSCDNAMSQSEMTACSESDRKQADTQLNASYGRLMQRLSAGSQTRLKASQRAWIAFRDAECLMRSNGADGGSVSPMIANSCAAQLSRVRSKDLDALSACEEGDVSCPR